MRKGGKQEARGGGAGVSFSVATVFRRKLIGGGGGVLVACWRVTCVA